MRRKDRQITDPAIIAQLLERTRVLHLSLFDGDYPYIVPLHYGYEFSGDQLVFYMHSAREGHKLDLIRANEHACVELENDMNLISGGDVACMYGSSFSSLIARGSVEILQNADEKIHALKLLMQHQTGRDFDLNEAMAASVDVLRFTSDSYTVKAKPFPG